MKSFFKRLGLCLIVLPPISVAEAAHYLDRSDFGQLLPTGTEGIQIWWCASGWKISKDRPAPVAAGNAVNLSAARNEADAAQVIVRPAKTLAHSVWDCTNFLGPGGASIPAAALEILRVGYVEVKVPTDPSGKEGAWPDPLLPVIGAVDLEGGVNHPFWLRITVPPSTVPGEYNAQLRLKFDGGEVQIPLQLRVFAFSLPGTMHCVTAFGFSPGVVFQYHGLQNEQQQREVLAKYWESFSRHHISSYDPAPLDPFAVTWPEKLDTMPVESLRPTINWTGWDVAMQEAMDKYHFTSFILPTVGLGGGTFHSRVEPSLLGFAESTLQYQAAFKHYWYAVQEHLREKGWLDRSYIYWFDEPDPKDYDFVNNGFRKLKEAAPDIPRMLTEQPEPGLLGGPTLWCPITPEFNVDKACVRMTQGEKFWWYVCTGPKAPFATLFTDHPATELRVWLWQTWQRGIHGILIWQSNYWNSPEAYPDAPQNPYEDPMSWMTSYDTQKGQKIPWGNGDGRFIYPPLAAANGKPSAPELDGPVDSIRWEMLRDGIEDYEYMHMLQQLFEGRRETLSVEERSRIEKVLEVPASITMDMTTFTQDPGPIEQHRLAVAAAIEQLMD
ncbi:MAG: DUF4091 domain-containing protein [Candidatus Hydrogenedentes bacterium]|nr:DUF4091 domain-containing protein [Candidatus Hydrogenedentota bacterium]